MLVHNLSMCTTKTFISCIIIGLMAGSLANTKNGYLSKIKSWICVFLPLVQWMKNEEPFQYLLWGSVWLAFLIALFFNFHQFYLLARRLLARDGFSSCHQQPPVAATQTPDPLTKQMIPCVSLMVSESQPQINCNWPQINCNSFIYILYEFMYIYTYIYIFV